jgi:redox-sensing transcriptional repressor
LEEELETFLAENQVRLAIICVPAEFAQGMVNRLVRSGIQGILNFSPAVLEVPKEIVVNSVDLASELENLSYFIR